MPKDLQRRKAWTKRWREANKDIIREKRRMSYQKNRQRDLAKNRLYFKTHKAEYKANRVKNKEHTRDVKFKKHYGITLDIYNGLLVGQKNVCAICKNGETMIDKRNGEIRALAVDHCHKTGIVRGLLCRKCNNGLGMFKEDSGLLRKAIIYIKIHE